MQLLTHKNPALPNGGVTQLTVTEAVVGSAEPATHFTFAEPDGATLVRRHPEVADKYLRPLAAELGQEDLFAPDALLAAQVFPENAKPDEATAARVAALLPDLDAADYRRRDRALADLQALGPRRPWADPHRPLGPHPRAEHPPGPRPCPLGHGPRGRGPAPAARPRSSC